MIESRPFSVEVAPRAIAASEIIRSRFTRNLVRARGVAKNLTGIFLLLAGGSIGAVEGATTGQAALGIASIFGGWSLMSSGARDDKRAAQSVSLVGKE